MVKLKAPFMSLKATGRLGKLFSLARRQGQNIIERRPKPTDAKSPAQLFNRNMFSMCKDLWHLLSDAEKQVWESAARPLHMSGYAWYISQCLRPNPGIYLPLIGGKMSGDIDMDGNKIEDLPNPTANQEAATKAYADTHGMQAHENTHVAGGTDDIDSALAIAAMAGLATGKIWIGNVAGRPFAIDLPAAGATFTIADTEVFDGVANCPAAMTDLDLSGVVGSNSALVLLVIVRGANDCNTVHFRRNGDTTDTYGFFLAYGNITAPNRKYHLLVLTDTSGIVEWFADTVVTGVTVAVTAYIK